MSPCAGVPVGRFVCEHMEKEKLQLFHRTQTEGARANCYHFDRVPFNAPTGICLAQVLAHEQASAVWLWLELILRSLLH